MSRRTIFKKMLGKNAEITTNFDDEDGLLYEMDPATHKQFASQITTALGEPPNKNPRSIRRRNMLLGYLVANASDKLQVTNYKAHLNAAKDIFADEDDVTFFVNEASKSLAKVVPNSFSEEVVAFHRRKNKSQKDRAKKLEMMRMFDIEKVRMVDPSARTSISNYETSETLIKRLLEGIEENYIDTAVVVSDETQLTPDHRRNQTKFGYALLNVGGSYTSMIKDIFRRYTRYKELKTYEMAFIHHVFFETDDDYQLRYIGVYDMIRSDFFFVIERYLLEEGCKILDASLEHVPFLLDLLEDSVEFNTLKENYCTHPRLRRRMRCILNQMYILSGCDKSIALFRKTFCYV